MADRENEEIRITRESGQAGGMAPAATWSPAIGAPWVKWRSWSHRARGSRRGKRLRPTTRPSRKDEGRSSPTARRPEWLVRPPPTRRRNPVFRSSRAIERN